jgi:hypothetical protein
MADQAEPQAPAKTHQGLLNLPVLVTTTILVTQLTGLIGCLVCRSRKV